MMREWRLSASARSVQWTSPLPQVTYILVWPPCRCIHVHTCNDRVVP